MTSSTSPLQVAERAGVNRGDSLWKDFMKPIFTILFTGFFFSVYGQHDNKKIIQLNLHYIPASITLCKDNLNTGSIQVQGGTIRYNSLDSGYYQVIVSGAGMKSYSKDSVWVNQYQQFEIKLNVDGPCIYDHPPGYIPICPENHKDAIVPIIYGLVLDGGLNRGKDVKFHLGGCLISNCDPQYYCTIHKIEF